MTGEIRIIGPLRGITESGNLFFVEHRPETGGVFNYGPFLPAKFPVLSRFSPTSRMIPDELEEPVADQVRRILDARAKKEEAFRTATSAAKRRRISGRYRRARGPQIMPDENAWE